ncbi:M48 family metallopeptidase [Paenibacillus sp. Soil787]|uniref:M48 family metallopeptidase n=1 Tax=Paenibacillus sp. Soil787 TaxID=1736411 RepID=UPI0006FD199C|nr:SprT family zinc-dependent metalloprotease [Paenibacillus sp. Soil787]KRF31952.1 zinc metalloprotease [Paenibacillus sp. Soil787]
MSEIHKFHYGNSTIDYSLTYGTKKKDITVSVDWVNGVGVNAPDNIEQGVIDRILHKKAPWILKKLYEFNEIKQLSIPKEYLSGEKFPYLGRQYRLKVNVSNIRHATLSFHQGRFIAEIPMNWDESQRQQQLYELFRHWYITHGYIKIQERLRFYSAKMECSPSKLIVKDQQMRWGSCTKNGTININWKILMAPMAIVDYVIVHELAHMKQPDHSPAFWATVQSVLPDYESRKEWLRVHGATLTF